MSYSEQPAVQRAQPPKGPYVVVNAVMRWMLSSPRRARRMGIRINVDRMPTREELVEAAGRERLSVIFLTLAADSK